MNRSLKQIVRMTAMSAGLAGVMLGCESTGNTSRGEYDRPDAGSWNSFGTGRNAEARPEPAANPAPAPRRSGGCGVYRPEMAEGEVLAELAFPTGTINTSAILLQQVMPGEVARGADFGFHYYVSNLTETTLQNVTVMLDSSSNLDISSSSPAGTDGVNGTVWALGELGPCETKVIDLTASADRVGMASDCISVSYNNFLCATIKVVEPALALTKTATERALQCDDIMIRYTVRNTGTGVATDVAINDTLPEGLTMTNGSRNVNIPVGNLAAGESRTFEVKANASETGTFESGAEAVASGGLEADARATTTVVVAPELELSAECREGQYLGRNMTYSYTLENTGNGEAVSTVASASIPAGTTLVSSSSGGTVQGSSVVWDFGTLNAGATRQFSITVAAAQIGDYESTAVANADCANAVDESCSTEVSGIPAILLEVIDVNDPVEVGTETVYVIRVTNQGSAAGHNIRIVAELPEEQSYISSTGATNANASGNTIRFAPVGVLGVGASAEWRVTVRADEAGDVRFALEMTSDELSSPVNETEATNLYD